MAPRKPERSHGYKAAAPRNQPPKKRTVVNTAYMFKKQANPSTMNGSGNKNASATNASLASKPRGITKRKPHRNATLSPRKLEKIRLEHPLSAAFNESSSTYRSTVLADAQASLSSTRRGLLSRLTRTNGPFPNPDPTAAAPADAATTVQDPSTRVPTTAELQAKNDALVATLTAPLADDVLVYNDDKKDPDGLGGEQARQPRRQRLGDSMDEFRTVVAREKKALRELRQEWGVAVGEVQLLAEDLLGKEAVRAIMGASAAEDWRQKEESGGGSSSSGGRGGVAGAVALDRAEVEERRRELEQLVDEVLQRADEVEEHEKRQAVAQKKQMAQSIMMMGDL